MTITFQHEAVVSVLKKHFEAEDRTARSESHRLSRCASLANMMEVLHNDARPPNKDIDSLAKAAKNLARTQREISALGWFGKKALPGLQDVLNLPEFTSPLADRRELWPNSGEILLLLGNLERKLRSASRAVDPNAAPPISALSAEDERLDFRGRGTPKKLAKRHFVDALAQTYWRLTGERPGPGSFSSVDNTHGGRFLSFVRDVFAALQVGGNEVELVEEACRSFEPQGDGDGAPGHNAWPGQKSRK